MTIDKDASYYDLDIHNVGIVETDQLVRCILERAGLTAHASHRLGVLIERIARLGAKPGTDVQREVGKIAIEAGMLRDSVLWDQPLSEVLAELREIHAKTEWAQMDDPVGELMRMRHGDEETPDPAARIAEMERELERSEARADARLRNMNSARDRIAELERERDKAREGVLKVQREYNNLFDSSGKEIQALKRTLDTERQAAVATAEELERVRKELADVNATLDDTIRGSKSLAESAEVTRRELAALRDRYRPRRQSEEPAPYGTKVLRWTSSGPHWEAWNEAGLSPGDTWTHQPPAPGEGE